MSSLFAGVRSFFVSFMTSLGFINKQATIIMLGLDNAGKTTLQYKLKTGLLKQFIPTQRAKEETMQIDGVTIKTWDLGGHQAARQLWTKYCAMADGIIFMLDASDPTRLDEAAAELSGLLSSPEIEGVPVAVFANKSDIATALTLQQLEAGLKMNELTHPLLQLYQVSVIKGTGYTEGLRWLASHT